MKITYIYVLLIIVVIGGLIVVRQFSDTHEQVTSVFDGFAQCLDDSGAKFYGAFWCPHCNEQKALFEHSTKLPYIECSTPDRQSQTQICINENITGYPTWKFSDGSVERGVVPLDILAEKTGCTLPL